MKVALVSAPYDTAAFRIGENLGIKYLASTLNQVGVSNDVLDPALLGIDDEDVVARLLMGRYDLIGFSVMFDTALPRALAIIEELRRAGCSAHITMGGHVPTFNDVDILQQSTGLDSVVRFEGEETLLELVSNVDHPARWADIRGLSYRAGSKITTNSARALIADLDSIPFPARDDTSRHLGDPHFFVVTTRGCPYTCTFCSIPAFYKTPSGVAWRARSIENVIAELTDLRSAWGAQTISFLDDEFLVGRNGKKRAAQLADEIRLRGLGLTWAFECRADDVDADLFARLKAGGLRHVFIGIESGVQRMLDTFDKRTTVQQNQSAIETVRELDLSLAIGFIMFDPYVTADELLQNVQFLEDFEIGSYKAVANRVLVYRGTLLQQQLDRERRLKRHGLVLEYDFVEPTTELIYRIAAEHLKPFHLLNLGQRRLEYRLDNAPDGDALATRLKPLTSLVRREVNTALASAFREVIKFAESCDQSDVQASENFGCGLRNRIDDYVAAQMKRLDEVHRQLDGGDSGVG